MHLLTDLVEYDETEAYRLEQDPTGLLNEGMRYRDPSTGTFLTRDPLGMMDGPNMYTYVRQNPWTKFDAEGLSIWSAVEHNAALAARGAGAVWADTAGRAMGGPGSGLTAENYRQAGIAGAKSGAVFAAGVAVTAATAGVAAPIIAGAIGVGATATVATGMVAGGGGAAAAQMTSNVLNGQPATKNVGQAAVIGAALGGAGALAGETATAFGQGVKQGAQGAGAAPGGASARTVATGDLHAPGDVPGSYPVVKGGTGAPPAPGTTFSGATGHDLTDAGRGVPNNQLQKTTAGDVRTSGGSVTVAPEGTPTNYRHVDVTEGGKKTTFGPPQPNPAPKTERWKKSDGS